MNNQLENIKENISNYRASILSKPDNIIDGYAKYNIFNKIIINTYIEIDSNTLHIINITGKNNKQVDKSIFNEIYFIKEVI